MTLNAALGFLGRFRILNSDMPMAQAHCLLLIAKNEGLSLKELAQYAKVKMATASRYVSQLSAAAAPGQPGLGLVVAREDPMERRKKIIALTPKGKATVDKLLGDK